MRPQFSLMIFLLAMTVLATVLWNYAPKTNNVNIEKTGRMLDLAIVGDGYFPLEHPDGRIVYCRHGRFDVNLNGQLEHQATSYPLDPGITIPSDQPHIMVTTSGQVFSTKRNDSSKFSIGQISVLIFIRPDRLLPIGNGCFEQTDAAGKPLHVTPGDYESGPIAQGWLERETPRWTLEGNLPILMLLICVTAAAVQTGLAWNIRRTRTETKLNRWPETN